MKTNLTTLTSKLTHWATERPNQIAYTFLKNGENEEIHITYNELHQKAKAIAATLQMMTTKGDRAVLLYPSGIEFIEAFFGCLYAGVIAVPAYHNIKKNPQRLTAILEDAAPKMILTAQKTILEAKNLLNESCRQIKWQATDTIHNNRARFYKTIQSTEEDITFLQYTSGSTSAPKGVMISHENLMYQFAILQASSKSTANDHLFTWLPLYHDMGLIGNILFTTYLGSKCVFMSPTSFLKKPVRWLEAISKYQIAMSGAPNFAYDLVAKRTKTENINNLDLSSWKVAFCGAEPIRVRHLQCFAETFQPFGFQSTTLFPCYGLAEATLMVTASGVGKGFQTLNINKEEFGQSKVVIENDETQAKTIVSSGQQILSQEIRIVEPNTRNSLRELEVGEIWVSGKHIAKAYWNKPQISQERLQASLENEPHQYLCTGDLGFMYNGQLFITGRIKDLIKINGRGLYPQDLEFAIEDLQKDWTEIKNGGIGIFSFEKNQKESIAVFVEINPRRNPNHNPKALSNAIMNTVTRQFNVALADVVLIKSGTLPKTTSGKTQRFICRERYLNNFKNQIAPIYQCSKVSKPIHKQRKAFTNDSLLKIWLIDWVAAELEISKNEINPSEELTNYGLESLSAVSLADAIEQKLNINVSSTIAHEFNTIDAIVEHLSQ